MDIVFKGRHTDVLERFRKHATGKLAKIEKLDRGVIRVDVEVTAEHNPRQAGRKERVELTITTRGPAIRAEAAAEDRFAALDLALAKLESRLRRACDRRKDRYGYAGRPETAAEAALEAELDSAAEPGAEPVASDLEAALAGRPCPPAGRPPTRPRARRPPRTTARRRSSRSRCRATARWSCGRRPTWRRPMTIDQALFEMELIGHDFFLFTDTGAGLPSVVYRRRGYQYGVIRLVAQAGPAGSAGLASGAARPAANLATG